VTIEGTPDLLGRIHFEPVNLAETRERKRREAEGNG